VAVKKLKKQTREKNIGRNEGEIKKVKKKR
jgi:hypothetical protein